MIELWGMGSPNVQKVTIALEELGLRYRLHHVDVLMNEQYSPEFTALNPNRKVPVIVDPEGPDGEAITLSESGAILIYLAEKSGQLMPSDAAGRYRMMQWLMFQTASVGPMFGQHTHFKLYAKDEGHAYSRSRYATEVKRIYDVVETRLAEARYLSGDVYTIADIATWPWLRGHQARGVDMATIPNVLRWIDDVGGRPAVMRVTAVIDAAPRPDFDAFAREHGDKLDRYLGRGRYSRA